MRTMLFNPYTGKQRDPRDIASDPTGSLMADPEEPMRPALSVEHLALKSASLELLRRWERDGELLPRVWGTLMEQERLIMALKAAQPAGQADPDDSLLLCVSDLQHSAIFDNHVEMIACVRAVSERIRTLATLPARAIRS